MALAKLSPIIRISDNNQWALQLERSPYRSIAKLAQPELKLAGMRISPETFNTSRQAEYTSASLMNIATQEEIKIEGIPDNAVITEASFSPSSNKVALFVEEADGVYLYICTPEQPVAQKVSTVKSTRQVERRSYGLATMSLLRLWFRETGVRHRRNPQFHPVPSFKKVLER